MKNTMTKGEIRHELAKAKKELKDAWICGEGYEYDQNFIVCYKDGTVLETREANERLPQIGIIGIQFFGTDAHYTVGYEMYNGEKVLIEDESEDACYRVEYLPLISTETTAETVESVEETTVSETETVEKIKEETTMAKRFYFTNENGDNIGNDHIGNIRGAKAAAKRLANEFNCEVCINDCETEDMLDFVYPDRKPETETVEETAEQETELNAEVEKEQTENNAESVSETYGGADVKADTSKADKLSGATKILMAFGQVVIVSEYFSQRGYIDTS